MELTKKDSFTKQIAIYIKQREYQKAYDLAKDFAGKFPQELAPHFLLAEASYGIGNFEETRAEGRKSFNMCRIYEDMLACALLTSAAYLKTGEYAKGYALLKEMEKRGDSEELQSALVAFSVALENEGEALSHLDKLYKLNEKLALEFAERLVTS